MLYKIPLHSINSVKLLWQLTSWNENEIHCSNSEEKKQRFTEHFIQRYIQIPLL